MTIKGESEVQREVRKFMIGLMRRNPHEKEFHQAVHEVTESLMPYLIAHPEYRQAQILERMTEPDRIVIFRVTWEDDQGNIRANRAWRVQFNNAIGPYKGGMRFHPSVTLSVLKFLGFEQVFKNSLTTLPMGGGKGGSKFNPKGKSEREVMRFCHSLMIELHRHIGEDTDVPAGDIGVGAREISFMFGMYKRLANRFTGILTGKGLAFGGSLIRTEATGYGAVYFAQRMLATRDDSVEGKTAVVSGSGNVAIYAIEKLLQLGAKVVTASDSGGYIYDPDGIDADKLAWLKGLKEVRRGRISDYAQKYGCEYYEDKTPWNVPCQLAFPCATLGRTPRLCRRVPGGGQAGSVRRVPAQGGGDVGEDRARERHQGELSRLLEIVEIGTHTIFCVCTPTELLRARPNFQRLHAFRSCDDALTASLLPATTW
jgi:glutamate dehydrogenase (NADP+)